MQRKELSQEQVQQRSRRFLKSRSSNKSSGVEVQLPSSQKSIKSYKQQQDTLPQKQSKSKKQQCVQGWQQHYDPEVDATYFYHDKSGTAQWTCPKTQKQQQQILRKFAQK